MKNRRRTPPSIAAAGSFDAWDWDGIPLEANYVLCLWSRSLCRRDPWCGMPKDDASGSMRIIISELLNEAREPYDRRRVDRLTSALRDHVDFRRRQEFSPRLVTDEIDTLKGAIGTALRESGASPLLVDDFAFVLTAELDALSEVVLEAGSS